MLVANGGAFTNEELRALLKDAEYGRNTLMYAIIHRKDHHGPDPTDPTAHHA